MRRKVFVVLTVCLLGFVGSAFPQAAKSGPSATAPAQQNDAAVQAREELDRGAQAFKGDRYDEAAEHFERAITLDPSLLTARLYLGTTYMQQWNPDSDTPGNSRYADLAIQKFSHLLQSPDLNKESRLHGLKSLAVIYYNRKELDKSMTLYQQCIELDPDDPEVYYMIGVIDWAEAYQAAIEIKAKIGLQVDDQYQDKEDHKRNCQEQQNLSSAKIANGIAALGKAIELRPNFEDAMAYMNLLYRRKGDLECADSPARAADIRTADEWADKTMETRKAKMRN
jgi:tetratricopeptide (TPR) repeat protein